MRMKAAGAGLAVIAGMVGVGSAAAAPAATRVVAAPGATSAGYATRLTVVKKGTKAFFRNLDAISHNVVAVKHGANGAPLFRTPLVGLGKEAEIPGVSALATGSYAFFCSLHPNMKGTLRIIA